MIYLRQDLFNPMGEEYQSSNIEPVGQPLTHYKQSQIDKPFFPPGEYRFIADNESIDFN
jgi:hypothetical protein